MERKVSGLKVLAVVAAMLCFVFTGQAFALSDDSVMSQHVLEADGTSGQNTNSGSGIKTGHIQDGAITTPKIVNGAVTDDKISGTISGSKLGSHTHNGSDITSGTIGVDKLATYSGVRIVHKGSVDGVNTFSTVAAALSSVSGNSATNRYAVIVKPGIYNSSSVTMKDYVDVIGSGQGNTILEYDVTSSPVVSWPNGVTASLENLTVRGTGGGSSTEAMYIEGSATMRDVTVIVSNNSLAGILVDGWSWDHLEMYNSTLVLEAGTANSRFIENKGWGTVLIKDCIIDAATVSNRTTIGIYDYGQGAVTIDNSIIKLDVPDGGYGIISEYAGITIRNSTITVTADTDAYGTEGVSGNNVKIHNSTVVATTASPNNKTFGVDAWGETIEVNNSVVSGSNLGIRNGGGSFNIGSSQIIGGHNGTSGTDKVVNCHDGSYNPISDL